MIISNNTTVLNFISLNYPEYYEYFKKQMNNGVIFKITDVIERVQFLKYMCSEIGYSKEVIYNE